ncbi:hypothetical protein [Bacillus pumilus]|uniref:hypothetical protein n=1 Tax=Bacillus pumilus TaxID=1408 RepID=UPI0007EEEE54|nr:hypothetical protein [Bacillus pumilus]OBS86782.1 hypothetical protein BAY68_16620 [Bacillus pumilus]
MNIFNQLEQWTTFFVQIIIPISTFFITCVQFFLQRNENKAQKEYTQLTNYIQNGSNNEMNINVTHNKEAEKYFALQNEVEKTKQNILKFEYFSEKVDKVFIFCIYVTIAILFINIANSTWDSNLGIIKNFPTIPFIIMNTFQGIGEIVLKLIFGLIVIFLLKLIFLSRGTTSIISFINWIYLLFISIGSLLTFTVFKNINLAEEFNKIVNATSEPNENITILFLIEITQPLLIILLILATLIIGRFLLSLVLLKKYYFSKTAKNNFILSIIALCVIPFLFFYI